MMSSNPQSLRSQPLQPSAHNDHQLAAYRYDLPSDLIAQNPVTPRDSAKLLVVEGQTECQHRHFYDLVDFLLPGDLLVLNNTRVIPARLLGHKQTEKQTENSISNRSPKGAAVEVLLIEPLDEDRWLALVKPGRRIQPGTTIVFGGSGDLESAETPLMSAFVESRDETTNGRILKLMPQCNGEAFPGNRTIDDIIHQLGQIPLPPYITRSESLPEQYQTVFASRQGAIAAPTAGLHFTDRLLNQLAEKGIQTAEITLHVGIGTFRPVEVSDIETHQMHQERIEISESTVEKIRQTKANGGRVIAVGTTSTRALEGVASICGGLQPYSGKTEIFIYPGYQWQVIDGLITNFHLPGSSLLMMVSALIGRQRLMGLYKEAITQQYRFYSFGDAMLILPEAKTHQTIA
jgi:S-adenosylmethionine:tRNA ribosyltransferase-isomerase